MKKLFLLGLLVLSPLTASAVTQECFSRFDGALFLSLTSTRVTSTPTPIVSLTGATYFHTDKNIRAVFGAGVQRFDGTWILNFESLDPMLLDAGLNPINPPGEAPWTVVPCS